ncbi:4-hydroxybenzoate octaprenyltransferase [Fodinicurvata halophila]|uniref:4-hydroxybenzoate octaprenyltransferase n=1 Tax=Fodinicurvata halophila TaxID=1419723 RepID=A0ABV8UIL5_9PROT
MSSSTNRYADASDIVANNWLERRMPPGWRPYSRLARLDRPIGTWLLLFPCWWSIALAQSAGNQPPDLWLYLLFALGAMLMRAAGCTVNDILDRHYDGRVARTSTRPLPSGQITLRQAIVFLLALLAGGLAILLALTPAALLLGVASLLLVFPYPLMKRITYWPQLWLGLTFNWGALMGWAAVENALAWPPVLLYIAGIFWTLGYDTIYAHQDKEDDALIGLKSSALKLGERTRPWLIVFYALCIAFMGAAGIMAEIAWPYYLGLAAVAVHFTWQVTTVDIHGPRNCLARFRSNRFVGWLLLAGLVLAGLAG